MRTLWISILSLGLLVGIWFGFYQYSENALQQLVTTCEEQVMPAIEKGDWETAYAQFSSQYDMWHEYQNRALYMLETESINKTDEAFAKTLMYIKAQDYANSSGELLALQESLKVLHQSEAIKLNNIL